MSEYYNVVPWYNSEEWNNVYEQLYSDISNKKDVLNQLLVWKARCPSLPAGIESTLTLLQIHIQDQNVSDCTSNEQILRLAYSSAVMRFVNHMLDTESAKGTSLYKAAKHLGVPDWIIDLRHDTAHSNNLPSLQLLRDATQIGLEWLKNNYWDKHKPYIQDYSFGQRENNLHDENTIALLMDFCTSLSIFAHPKCNIKSLAAIPDAGIRASIANDAQDILGKQIDFSVNIKALINLLDIQSHKLLKLDNTTFLVNQALLGEDSVLLSFELLKFMDNWSFTKKNKLHSSYVQCFEVLLRYLHTHNLLGEFILALMKETQSSKSDSDNQRELLAALWVSEILSSLNGCRDFIKRIEIMGQDFGSKTTSELKQLYHHWFPNKRNGLVLDLWKDVPSELTNITNIQPIISSYNTYLTYFIHDLLNLVEPRLPVSVMDKICKLAKLISSPDKFPNEPSHRIYTEDDLKPLDSNAPIEICDETAQSGSDGKGVETSHDASNFITDVWRLASKNLEWGKTPIGQLPY